jgi:hypothetical protein
MVSGIMVPIGKCDQIYSDWEVPSYSLIPDFINLLLSVGYPPASEASERSELA